MKEIITGEVASYRCHMRVDYSSDISMPIQKNLINPKKDALFHSPNNPILSQDPDSSNKLCHVSKFPRPFVS